MLHRKSEEAEKNQENQKDSGDFGDGGSSEDFTGGVNKDVENPIPVIRRVRKGTDRSGSSDRTWDFRCCYGQKNTDIWKNASNRNADGFRHTDR